MAYAKVEETFWHDSLVRSLTETGRVLFFYLITCPHRNRLGCYVMDPMYAAADLQWAPERVSDGLVELQRRERIDWDPEHRVVFVRRHAKHNTLENPQVVKGAISDLRAMPDTYLLKACCAAFELWKRAHYRDLFDAFAQRFAQLLPQPLPQQSDEPTRATGSQPLTQPLPRQPVTAKATVTVLATEASPPENSPSPHARDALAIWLGEYASAIETCRHAEEPRARDALFQHYGPPGLRANAWRRDDGSEFPVALRPRVFAVALSGYGLEQGRFVDRQFENKLRGHIRDETPKPVRKDFGDETGRDAQRQNEARKRQSQREAEKRRADDEAAQREAADFAAWWEELDADTKARVEVDALERCKGLPPTARRTITTGVMHEYWKRAGGPQRGASPLRALGGSTA